MQRQSRDTNDRFRRMSDSTLRVENWLLLENAGAEEEEKVASEVVANTHTQEEEEEARTRERSEAGLLSCEYNWGKGGAGADEWTDRIAQEGTGF